MAIIQNELCPECSKTGHDSKGNHLVTFENGAKYCKHSEYHESGEPLYIAPDGKDPALDSEVTGKIKYTPAQFRALEEAGKLHDDFLRTLALGGMKEANRYEVMTDAERLELEQKWAAELEYFNGLKFKHLVDRHIKGPIAKLYNVRVGHNAEGHVDKHYYPLYCDSVLEGAECRNLPKDFRYGHLGQKWGRKDLFGMHTMQEVMNSGRKGGRRLDTLVVTGGHCDAMAAQQMLLESQINTDWEGTLFHCWSVNKGENCIQELIDNKHHLSKFRRIIWAFDGDSAGQDITKAAAKMFPSKSYMVKYPSGCKDPNDCLKFGMAKDFVNSYFNPAEISFGSRIRSVAQLSKRAKEMPKMGLSWPWPGLDPMTMGIRDHMLILLGAGSGVGKTKITKSIVKHLLCEHGEPCGVIYTEEPANQTLRSYAGEFIGKRLALPPMTNKESPYYDESKDYTEEQANAAIDHLESLGLLFIADLEGDTRMETIMEAINEMVACGIKRIVLDNLTGITWGSSDKNQGSNKTEEIDNALKTLGNYKDEKPVTIFLVSHLKKVKDTRTPHEEGGEVQLDDFRGSGALKFWPNYVLGAERNTRADSIEEKCITQLKVVKDRDMGIYSGDGITLRGDLTTGDLEEVGSTLNKFDMSNHTSTGETKPEQKEESNEF